MKVTDIRQILQTRPEVNSPRRKMKLSPFQRSLNQHQESLPVLLSQADHSQLRPKIFRPGSGQQRCGDNKRCQKMNKKGDHCQNRVFELRMGWEFPKNG